MNRFLIPALFLIIVACSPDKPSAGVELHTQNGKTLLYVDMDQAGDTIDFDISEIVDSCRMIRLENRPEALIGRVSDILFSNQRIYLYHQEKLLMAFDYDGKYREQIGNLGKGPFEYKYLNNLAFGGDPRVVLGEPYDIGKYLIYNPDGSGKLMVPRKLGYKHFVNILPENQVLEFGYKDPDHINPNRNICLFIQGFNGEVILERDPLYQAIPYRVGGISMPISIYQYKDQYRVHFSRDTLFSLDIKNGTITPVAVFTASKNGYDYQKLDRQLAAGENTFKQNLGKVYHEIHAETREYFLIRQIQEQLYKDGSSMEATAVSYICVDKNQKNVHPVRLKDSFWGLELDNEKAPMPFTKWSVIDNQYAVIKYQGIELKEEIARRLKDNQLSPGLQKKLKSLDESVSEDDNLILFVYYLKK